MLIVQYKWHTFAYFYWTVVLWEWTSLWFVQCYAAYGQVFFISGLHSSCGCMTLIFYWTLQVDNVNCYECLHITGEFISKQVQLELSIPLISNTVHSEHFFCAIFSAYHFVENHMSQYCRAVKSTNDVVSLHSCVTLSPFTGYFECLKF